MPVKKPKRAPKRPKANVIGGAMFWPEDKPKKKRKRTR